MKTFIVCLQKIIVDNRFNYIKSVILSQTLKSTNIEQKLKIFNIFSK